MTRARPRPEGGRRSESQSRPLLLEDAGFLKIARTVRVENATQKFLPTSAGYEGESANNQIQEIRIGGTTVKLLFDQDGKTAAAGAGR